MSAVVIGRAPECNIQLGDTNVSRRHAEVRPFGTGFLVVDLGSTNGTRVNGASVSEHQLKDGDTITVRLDVGFDIQFTSNGRFYGINAPEMSTAAGKDARAYLLTRITVGSQVTVISRGWDKYGGRFDGVIHLPDGTDLNQAMVDSGHAVPYLV